MTESYEQKKRRLFGQQNMKNYLGIVEKLTVNLDVPKVLSLIETDKILDEEKEMELNSSLTLSFSDKSQVKQFVLKNLRLTVQKIYMITSLSKDCGIIEFESLHNFNFDFNFSDDPNGLISLINYEMSNKVLLDFYEEGGQKLIDLEYHLKSS